MALVVGTLDTLGAVRRRGMFSLRHRVFEERLQWSVGGRQGLESDRFDNERAVYVIDEDGPARVVGCVRLLPTVTPYLLAQVFPDLLNGAAAPCQPDVWELSRFAFDKTGNGGRHWGFSFRVIDILAEAVGFACTWGIRRFVFATTMAVRRLMAIQGLHAYCLGPPRRFGRVDTVAMALEVNTVTLRALGSRRAATGAAPRGPRPALLERCGT